MGGNDEDAEGGNEEGGRNDEEEEEGRSTEESGNDAEQGIQRRGEDGGNDDGEGDPPRSCGPTQRDEAEEDGCDPNPT